MSSLWRWSAKIWGFTQANLAIMVCVQSIFKENLSKISKWAVAKVAKTLVQWRAPNNKISEETRIVDAKSSGIGVSPKYGTNCGYHCTIPSYLSILCFFMMIQPPGWPLYVATQPNSRSRSTQICCPFIVFDIGLHEGLPETQRAPKWFAFYWRTELSKKVWILSLIYSCVYNNIFLYAYVHIYIIISLGGWRLPKIHLRACFSQTVSIHNFGITFIPLYFALT